MDTVGGLLSPFLGWFRDRARLRVSVYASRIPPTRPGRPVRARVMVKVTNAGKSAHVLDRVEYIAADKVRVRVPKPRTLEPGVPVLLALHYVPEPPRGLTYVAVVDTLGKWWHAPAREVGQTERDVDAILRENGA